LLEEARDPKNCWAPATATLTAGTVTVLDIAFPALYVAVVLLASAMGDAMIRVCEIIERIRSLLPARELPGASALAGRKRLASSSCWCATWRVASR
jgi:hypothetical protein